MAGGKVFEEGELPCARGGFVVSSSRVTSLRATFGQNSMRNSGQFCDGILVIRHDQRWVMLVNEMEYVVESRFLHDGEVIQVGLLSTFLVSRSEFWRPLCRQHLCLWMITKGNMASYIRDSFKQASKQENERSLFE
jgi:hypothetical protein